MIGKAGTGNGFLGLLDYLLAGSDGQQQDRVEWLAVRNLATEEPDLLPAILRSTTAQSDRVEKPVYHLVISLEPGEQLERTQLEQIVDRTLKDLDLEEHQAVVVAHRDTDHPHVHIMLNRVHPETRLAWDNGHDYARIERSLRHQERELGLREVPGRHFVLPGQERYRDVNLSTGSRKEAERTGEKPFGEQVRGVAREPLRKAKSWESLHSELAEVGLFLERRGRGLVLTNGTRRTKASFVDRKASRAGLEKRLGPFVEPAPELVAGVAERWADVVGLRREIQELTQHYQGHDQRQREERTVRLEEQKREEEVRRLEAQSRAASTELDRRLAGVFTDPKRALERLTQAIHQRGLDGALEAFEQKPQDFGRLRGRGGVFANAERWAAREGASQVASGVRDMARITEQLERLRTRLDHTAGKGAATLKKGFTLMGRRLARSANRRVQRMGWQVAARILPTAHVRLLKNVLKLGVGWNVPHLKVLALSLEAGRQVLKTGLKLGMER